MSKDKFRSKIISRNIRNKREDSAYFMALLHQPFSDEAFLLEADLADRLWNGSRFPSDAFRKATGAVAADLIAAHVHGADGYGWRPFDEEGYLDLPVTISSVRAVRRSLEANGYIEIKPESGAADGYATRMRATEIFLDLIRAHGIDPSAHRDHFHPVPRPKKPKLAVRLKRASGDRLKFDPTGPAVAPLFECVNEINAFMAEQDFGGGLHWSFYRGFNLGDQPGFNWNKGGRLYSVGAGSYQQQKSAVRAAMTINGEPVVEIDIRASYLTILRAKLGLAFDPTKDPYAGLVGIPRDVAKSWVIMTLGYDKLHQRWSDEAKRQFIKMGGTNLTKEYPLKKVRAKMLELFPFLEDWGKLPIGWADLQFWESEAVVNTVHELATVHGIPALPVHDSLIVPVSAQEKATEVLKRRFKDVVGIEPHLTVK